MVKPRDECPACESGALCLAGQIGGTTRWTCTAYGVSFDEPEDGSRREPASDGN